MKLAQRNKVSPEFNMSSMTDLVFLLLIFFMLTSTLVTPAALDVVLPKSKAQTVKKATVTVTIDKDLNYSVGTEVVAPEDVEAFLLQELNKKRAMDVASNKRMQCDLWVKSRIPPIKEPLVKSVVRLIAFSSSSLVAILHNRHFTFIAPQQTSDVLLVGEQYQQGHRNGKYPIQRILHIEDNQDKYGKGNTSQNGTQRNKTGQIQNQQEYPHARNSRPG